MDYDHHANAGNPGDVVKHVALAAGLDILLDISPEERFRYADTFAGYALNPIVEANRREGGCGWGDGIGRVGASSGSLDGNRHVKWWANRYLGHSDLIGGDYPGSSVIARDVCSSKGRQVRLSLWDISPEVIVDLKRAFGDQDHGIFPHQANPSDPAVHHADFLLIDPPGLRSKSHPKNPPWSGIRQFLVRRPARQSVLLWLPVKAKTTSGRVPLSPPGEDQSSWAARDDAVLLGYRAMRVRWAAGGRTIGCHLIYDLPERAESALKEAVGYAVDLVSWRAKLPSGLAVIRS